MALEALVGAIEREAVFGEDREIAPATIRRRPGRKQVPNLLVADWPASEGRMRIFLRSRLDSTHFRGLQGLPVEKVSRRSRDVAKEERKTIARRCPQIAGLRRPEPRCEQPVQLVVESGQGRPRRGRHGWGFGVGSSGERRRGWREAFFTKRSCVF